VACDASASLFYRGNIVNTIEQILRETGLDPKWLDVELMETLTLDTSENATTIMQDLKRLGVGLSLVDFGTGWSSLSYLSRFPLDRLKIDRSFMRDIAFQQAAQAVVESIISLASNLGLSCIGEGVETEQQLDYLRAHNCAEIHGFLYSPPLPTVECGELLPLGKPDFKDGGSLEFQPNPSVHDVLPPDPPLDTTLQKGDTKIRF
jgi:EAL domain-containing protein (putative c-di-GMP-specific phosphodiesterase class I)